jgi:hypothetical protein
MWQEKQQAISEISIQGWQAFAFMTRVALRRKWTTSVD